MIGLFLCKQITGIEPASPAWEASILPMNYICRKGAESVLLYYMESFCKNAFLYVSLSNFALCQFCKSLEALCIIYCHLSKHLSVDVYSGYLKSVHELAVG